MANAEGYERITWKDHYANGFVDGEKSMKRSLLLYIRAARMKSVNPDARLWAEKLLKELEQDGEIG